MYPEIRQRGARLHDIAGSVLVLFDIRVVLVVLAIS